MSKPRRLTTSFAPALIVMPAPLRQHTDHNSFAGYGDGLVDSQRKDSPKATGNGIATEPHSMKSAEVSEARRTMTIHSMGVILWGQNASPQSTTMPAMVFRLRIAPPVHSAASLPPRMARASSRMVVALA